MPLLNWKKWKLRRKAAGFSDRVKNKRFYQEYGKLIMFHYSHLGVWYVLKLALIAKSFRMIRDNELFTKVHRHRRPELYDFLYHIISCERDVQAIILQRSIREFLRRRRLLRQFQEPRAITIQRWWRHLLESKIYPEKLRTNTARIRTIQEGLGYIVSTLARASTNKHYVGRLCDEVTPIALLVLQESSSLEATEVSEENVQPQQMEAGFTEHYSYVSAKSLPG